MNSTFFLSASRVAGLVGLIAFLSLALTSGSRAHASSFEVAALSDLTPKLALKSQLLARRFEFVLMRHQRTLKTANTECAAGGRGACRLGNWQAFLSEISAEYEGEQFYRVNRYLNNYRYRTDQRNWSRPDYWAVPEQLFERGGDCEDFVIAKYLSLRALGVAAERMRVVVVYDRKKREDHAVLAVSGPEGTLVLDNKFQRIMRWADLVDRYEPYYSLNETSVWIHKTKT